MDLLKMAIDLIVFTAERVDVEVVVALFIFYMVVVAVLFLIRILRGVRR